MQPSGQKSDTGEESGGREVAAGRSLTGQGRHAHCGGAAGTALAIRLAESISSGRPQRVHHSLALWAEPLVAGDGACNP